MSIKPDIHLHYHEKIWNVLPFGEKYILLELRDENTMTTSYDLYNFQDKEYQWRNLEVREKWKIGISYGDTETIVIHEYKRGTIPAIENLTGIDCRTGNTLWNCKDFQPLSFGKKSIKGSKENKSMILSTQTGALTEDVDNFRVSDEIISVSRPLTYTEGTDNFKSVKHFVKIYLNEEAKGSAEYLEHNNNIFIAYHTMVEDDPISYKVKLIGITESGDLWLQERLINKNALLVDIFFIWNKFLIFFNGQHDLKAINLNNK